MCVGEIEADYIGGVSAVVVDHAEVDVVAPIERVTAEIGMAKVRLPGIVIPPVKDLGMTVVTHVVVEALHLILAVAQIVLLARVFMKIIDPFNPNADFHGDAHLASSLG